MSAPFVLTMDDKYVRPAAACIASIVRGTPDPEIIVISQGLSSRSKHALRAVGKRLQVPVDIREAAPHAQALPIFLHFSSAIYTRLQMPEILAEYNRAVYVDADAIAVRSLDPLRRLETDKPVAAVRDPFVPRCGQRWRNRVLTGVSPGSPYVNTGVMVMNLDEWRRLELGAKCIDFVVANHEDSDLILYPDQDAVNVVIGGMDGIELLDPRWNVPPMSDLWCTKGRLPTRHDLQVEEEAFVTHFLGRRKPWDADFPDGVNRSRFYELGTQGLEVIDALLPLDGPEVGQDL